MPKGIGWQGLVMVGLPLFLQLLLVLLLEVLITEAKVKIESEYRSTLVMDQAMNLSHEVLNGSICCLIESVVPGNNLFGESFDLVNKKSENDLKALKGTMLLLPELKTDFGNLETCYKEVTQNWQTMLAAKGASKTVTSLGDKLSYTIALYSKLNAAAEKLIQASQNKANNRSDTRQITYQEVETLLITTAVAWLIASIAIAFFFSKNIAGRIKLLIENTQRFRQGKELLPPLAGTDEIADYDRAFHEMASSLVSSMEYKAQLLGIVSHEIKTSLASAQASLTNIGAGVYGTLNTAGSAYMKNADREITYIIKMVNDLIDIERLKAGQFPLKFIPVDMAFLVQETIAALQEQGITRPMSIAAQPLFVEGDIRLLTRLAVNFIQDCIQSSPENSPLSISVSSDKSRVIFAVDSYSELTNAQELFEISGSAKESHGISLALCKSIAEIHQGSIKAQDIGNRQRRLICFLPPAKA